MNRLKEIRNSLGLSQTDVAVQLGITQQAYANYERGVREADYGTLKKISEIFNTSIDYILGNSNESNINSEPKAKPFEKIIEYLSQLNPIGIEKAESYILDLLDNPKYTATEERRPDIPSIEEAMRLQKGAPLRTDRLGHDNTVHKAAFGGGVWDETPEE